MKLALDSNRKSYIQNNWNELLPILERHLSENEDVGMWRVDEFLCSLNDDERHWLMWRQKRLGYYYSTNKIPPKDYPFSIEYRSSK